MADEWVCDECGYSTSLEPEANICPACKSKMTKIDSSDDLDTKEEYDEDDLLDIGIDDEDEFNWDKEEEAEEQKSSK